MTASGPFACNMTALSSEQRLQHGELLQYLQSMLLGVRESGGGYAFEFAMAPGPYDALCRLTPMEAACCPFFTISIRLEPGHKLAWELSGSEGVKAFIRAEFAGFF